MSVARQTSAPAPTQSISHSKRFGAFLLALLTAPGLAGTMLAQTANAQGTTNLEQANGKRVVKVLASVGIGVVILNEIFTIEALNNTSGPFSGVVDTIGTTGVAALTLIVVGLIAYAGAVAMGYLDMF